MADTLGKLIDRVIVENEARNERLKIIRDAIPDDILHRAIDENAYEAEVRSMKRVGLVRVLREEFSTDDIILRRVLRKL